MINLIANMLSVNVKQLGLKKKKNGEITNKFQFLVALQMYFGHYFCIISTTLKYRHMDSTLREKTDFIVSIRETDHSNRRRIIKKQL